MAVKIRLKRMGKIRAPYYRVVVMDSRTKRDGRAIEQIGKYHPTEEPSLIDIDSERAQHWLSVGAQPTEQVAALLKITGDWQKFKGEPGAEGTLKVRAAKTGKKARYEAELAAAGGEDGDDAPEVKRRAKKAKASDEPEQKPEKKADEKAAERPAQEKSEEPAAEGEAVAAKADEKTEMPAEDVAAEPTDSTSAEN